VVPTGILESDEGLIAVMRDDHLAKESRDREEGSFVWSTLHRCHVILCVQSDVCTVYF
jgi:hypothetical protein